VWANWSPVNFFAKENRCQAKETGSSAKSRGKLSRACKRGFGATFVVTATNTILRASVGRNFVNIYKHLLHLYWTLVVWKEAIGFVLSYLVYGSF